jgi:hypothetical protein
VLRWMQALACTVLTMPCVQCGVACCTWWFAAKHLHGNQTASRQQRRASVQAE